ncbi:LPXTG cell wall anchor domain-containing protein [Leucobacter viscericola]|uniref:LPXTG cell wall anchor domain-containing protein n=1 Tax=Leucobacter viscericola TaxID=2714935 RepID=A0A6G7XBL8_9MICO|nr:SdrD B-like domain-containing protein [Leucobacter viscericola]QIK61953.1 LPXTG cell wall anchor domain-containing protein [Leucobacter viscericola]
MTVAQKTGTAPFTPGSTAAGDDPGDDDPGNIVRTNDTVTYTVGVRYHGEDQTNSQLKFSLPRGQTLAVLPPFCLAGSSVSPSSDSIPAPAVPLTSSSWESLPVQQVTCNLGKGEVASALDYSFVSKVRPEVPNGTVMDDVVFTAASDQATDPVATPPLSQTVSAAPQFDVSKRGEATAANQGPLGQSTGACPSDSTKACVSVFYPMTITAPQGGKGVTPLGNPIRFQDDLSPASFFGDTVWSQMVAKAGSESAARAAYAPMLEVCTPIVANSSLKLSVPYSKAGQGSYANAANSVRDSGSVDCTQDAPGDPAQITITNADTSAYTFPTTSGSGTQLSADRAYLFSYEIRVAVPQAAVLEFGGKSSPYTIATHNEFNKFEMTGIDGQANIGEKVENNDRDAMIRIQNGFGLNKFFAGIWGTPGNTPAYDFSDSYLYEGLPGSAKKQDGNTVVMPGQSVQSVLAVSATGPAGSGTEYSKTSVSCDVWDPSRLALAAKQDWHGYDQTLYPSNGKPVYVSGYLEQYTSRGAAAVGSATSGVKNLKIEYSSGPSGAGDGSDCSQGTWFADPSDVPGAKVNTDADGRTTWEGVNRVRVTYNTEWPEGTTYGATYLYMSIGQVVLDNGSSDEIGNWASQIRADGIKTAKEAIADPDHVSVPSEYDPATHKGSTGDRLIPGNAIVRVAKYVKNPETGEFTDTAVPLYKAGSSVEYRLNPSLTAAVPASDVQYPVTMEDCLPLHQVFKKSEQAGAAITPDLVQMGSPADAGLKCADDRQYVHWDLGMRTVGAAIDPVIVSTDILSTARNGTYANDVVVASPADTGPVSSRSDSVQIQILSPTGIKIAKGVDKPIIEVNPEGVTKPRTMTWSVQFANLDSSSTVSNVDAIDVLPANGENGNKFNGQLRFDSATPAAGDNINVLYTKQAVADLDSDPSASSNESAGATVWCDAVGGKVVSGSGSAADCPQNKSEVTGLRFLRSGEFTPDQEFQVDIAMTPINNAVGDHYRNITSGRADGVSQGVGPAARTVDVIGSTVGDYVWEDTNKDGLQTAGEPGVSDFPVRLIGTDVDGNAVDLQTKTDSNGHYLFEGLASGEYRVVFDPNALSSNTTFTEQSVGDDTSVDSDADKVTGETKSFTLGSDAEDLTLDAGLVIDRNVNVVLDKKLLGTPELDKNHNTTLAYALDVTNEGTADTTYDLSDKLKFGGDITINSVSVKRDGASQAHVNSDFDGQGNQNIVSDVALSGGETHTYLVTVKATAATKITASERDCVVEKGEAGSGFLNTAELVANGKTISDKACGEVPPIPEDSQAGTLAITGAAGTWTLMLGGLALAVLGAGAFVVRRRNRRA